MSDNITVTINIMDVNEIDPPLSERTQQVRDAIVAAIPGVDNADDVTPAHLAAITQLDLYGEGITSLKSGDFSGLTKLIHLDLFNNSISDISALEDLTVLTHLDLYDNSISNISVLSGLTKLTTLYLYGNPISDYAPLRRLETAIENANNYISIDIDMTNNPPVFSDGDSTTRSIQENTSSGTNIGAAVSATDADNHTLTYTLSGTDADAYSIVSASGQLQTKDPLDYETKSSYTLMVTAYDDNSGGDRITVTINVTNEAGAAPSVETSPIIPDRTALLTNFPNPFNPEAWIPYQLAEPAEVTLTIYDIRGVVVRELKLGHQAAGFYQSRARAIHWDGRNVFGEKVATGIYFYTLSTESTRDSVTAGDFTATRKLLIRK